MSVYSLEPDIQIAGQGDVADVALRLSSELLPDVVLLDTSMRGGMIALHRLARACPVAVPCALSVSADEDDVLQALMLGARGYLLKGVSGRELVSAVRTLARREVYLTAHVAGTLLAALAPTPSGARCAAGLGAELTRQEAQILELIHAGHNLSESAKQLELTEKRLQQYASNIVQKLHVRARSTPLAFQASLLREP